MQKILHEVLSGFVYLVTSLLAAKKKGNSKVIWGGGVPDKGGLKSKLGGAADAPRQTVKLQRFRDARSPWPSVVSRRPHIASLAFWWNLHLVPSHIIPTPFAISRRSAQAAWSSKLHFKLKTTSLNFTFQFLIWSKCLAAMSACFLFPVLLFIYLLYMLEVNRRIIIEEKCRAENSSNK